VPAKTLKMIRIVLLIKAHTLQSG